MRLSDYLARIRYTDIVRPDLATLRGLHRAHLHAVPFENLDVQLRRPVTTDVRAAYEKIVERGRGGWCYEMNGLFGWVLEQIGYEVVRLSAGVLREHGAEPQMGNHLCLLVQLDDPYLVDVGFGGSMLEPIAVASEARRQDTPYSITVSPVGDGSWHFVESTHDDDYFGFEFRSTAGDETLLGHKCQLLQTDPSSPFVQNLVAQRRAGDSHISLRGRVLTVMTAAGKNKRVLDSSDELVAVLREQFGLDVPEVATLWPQICARHEAHIGPGAT